MTDFATAYLGLRAISLVTAGLMIWLAKRDGALTIDADDSCFDAVKP